MKVLSYNIYGVKDTCYPVPKWEIRQKNIEKILNTILKDQEIKVCCFQEVNKNNIEILNKILINNNFKILDKFPMKTESILQYNIVAIKNEEQLIYKYIYCVPHGNDKKYKNPEDQIIDYKMSDYRTTVFVNLEYKNKEYLIGNIHTDYISTEGKVKGVIKTLNYMDSISADYKLVVGDMNMISHMSEAYNVLKEKNNYTTISRNKNFDITDNSWHGYGTQEQVNVDFAFIEKIKENYYEYNIIKQPKIFDEGSDHRPVIITIK